MLRVLLVTGSHPPMACGVGDYTRSLAHSLAATRGTRVAVLTGVEAGAAASCEPYDVFPIIRDWRREEAAAVRDVLQTWKPDVLHVQYPTQGYRGELALRLPHDVTQSGVPVVQTWHEYFPAVHLGLTPSSMPAVLRLGSRSGHVIVVRPDYARHLRIWYRAWTARKQFHFIPNASTVPSVDLSQADREAIRRRYAPDGKALLAFFGFPLEHKGIDEVLDLVDPRRHHLVMIGHVQESDPFQRNLVLRVRERRYSKAVTIEGFLPAGEVGRVLAAADAVVLPFRAGGGIWNTSIKAAALQGTFVLTTSNEQRGYDEAQNVYYARPRDVGAMRTALDRYLGHRSSHPPADIGWAEIAERHLQVYASAMREAPGQAIAR